VIERVLAGTAACGKRWPRTVVSLAGALTVTAVLLLATRFSIDPDLSAFLPEKLEALRLMRAATDHAAARALYVVVEGDDVAEAVPHLPAQIAAPCIRRRDPPRGVREAGRPCACRAAVRT